MRKSREKVRNQVLGPRALAVISCALAILAAQPAATGAQRTRETVASLKVAGVGTEYGVQKSEFAVNGRVADQKAAGREADRASFTTSPRLHILATVEMLQRWLSFELRPADWRVAALALAPVPVTVELLLAPPYRGVATSQDGSAALSHEQRIAIEHHLLAPPVA